MTYISSRGSTHSRRQIVVLVTLSSLLLKLGISYFTWGSNDVNFWGTFQAVLERDGAKALFHDISIFNHPPFMLHVLQAVDFARDHTSASFAFWLRLPAILADVGSVVLIWKLLKCDQGDVSRFVAVVLLAMAPPSIMISGFHGNTDPVMMFFVLLAVYALERGPSTWLAGLAFGMSINVKVVPLIFVPVFLLYLPTMRQRLAFFMASGAAIAIGSLPYILEDPFFMAQRILGYGSLIGLWGVTRLTAALPPHLHWIHLFYARYGRMILVASIVLCSLWMNWQRDKPRLFYQCGLITGLFLALTPGFGVQYLAWLVPWVAGLGAGAAMLYYVTSGMFLFLVYTFWSQGFPWYFADATLVGNWRGHIVYYELACWLAVVLIVSLFFRRFIQVKQARNPLIVGSG